MRLILASGSPRRQRLIRRLGVEVSVRVPQVEEWVDPAMEPVQAIRRIALAKAMAAGPRAEDELIVAADTAIVLDGEILGKPVDAPHALCMLKRMRGRSHSVVTALAVLDGWSQRTRQSHVTTIVRMSAVHDERLESYVDTGEPMGKAGAYAIQGAGANLVDSVQGCHLNVVGFPLCELRTLLACYGLSVSGQCTLPSGEPCPRTRMKEED